MIKRRKRGVILILIGIGIILCTFMFSSGEQWVAGKSQRVVFAESIIEIFGFEFPQKYPLTIGMLIAFIGIGMISISFFPGETTKEEKSEKD